MAHQRILTKTSKGGNIFPDIDYRTCKAVRAGNLVFVEGQTGLTMDNMAFVGEGDPAAQADNAMKNIKIILEAAGARMEDICKITTYVTDISYRDLVYPVLANTCRTFTPARPEWSSMRWASHMPTSRLMSSR